MNGRTRERPSDRMTGTATLVRSRAGVIVLLTLLTALGAYVRVPLPGTPVPATLQTFFVLVAGGVAGTAAGSLSQVLYLALGACGIPLFASPVLAGSLSPTFGYLVGFIFAAAYMGRPVSSGAGIRLWIGRGLAATCIIYLFGLSSIAVFTGGDVLRAASLGVAPFLLWDLGKVIMAALVISRVRGGAGKRDPGTLR